VNNYSVKSESTSPLSPIVLSPLDHEDRGKLLRNVGNYLPIDVASHPIALDFP